MLQRQEHFGGIGGGALVAHYSGMIPRGYIPFDISIMR
jgi:hypothetical protein